MSVATSPFYLVNDVAAAKNGGSIIFATDDFFAVAENLIKYDAPQLYEDYTEFGKRMDGWETRRRRKPGHDFCILRLAASSVIDAVELNTAFFTGNYAPTVSIQATDKVGYGISQLERISELGNEASDEEIKIVQEDSKSWPLIVGPVPLKPGYPDTERNLFTVDSDEPWMYLRLNLYPDGGVARLRVHGHVIPANQTCGPITDLLSFENGGECVQFSDAHFGNPKNLVAPFKGTSMADGWETARRLDRVQILEEMADCLLNHRTSEWAILKLGIPGTIVRLVVDTNYFKGNFPDQVKVEGTGDKQISEETTWETILPYSKVGPNKEYEFLIHDETVYRYVKLTIEPDGGVSRLRVYGRPSQERDDEY